MQNNIDNTKINMGESIQENILNKIKRGEIEMTSRQFFMMKWLTMGITSVFFLILGFYIFAYVIFLFSDNGLMVIPFDVEGGILKFIIEIPWTLVVLGAISIFLFSITSKTFYKIYRKPFLTFFFSILMCVVLSHLILLETGTMKMLKEKAFELGLPLAPDKLLEFRDSQTGSLFVGYVIATGTDFVTILDRRGKNIDLFVEESSILNTFLLGSHVNAYGTRLDGKVYVKSIEIVE